MIQIQLTTEKDYYQSFKIFNINGDDMNILFNYIVDYINSIDDTILYNNSIGNYTEDKKNNRIGLSFDNYNKPYFNLSFLDFENDNHIRKQVYEYIYDYFNTNKYNIENDVDIRKNPFISCNHAVYYKNIDEFVYVVSRNNPVKYGCFKTVQSTCRIPKKFIYVSGEVKGINNELYGYIKDEDFIYFNDENECKKFIVEHINNTIELLNNENKSITDKASILEQNRDLFSNEIKINNKIFENNLNKIKKLISFKNKINLIEIY